MADGYIEGGMGGAWGGLLVVSETLSPAKELLHGTNVGPRHFTQELQTKGDKIFSVVDRSLPLQKICCFFEHC